MIGKYYSGDQIKRNEMNGERRAVYGILVGRCTGRRLLGRPRRRWVGNIIVDLQDVGRGHEPELCCSG